MGPYAGVDYNLTLCRQQHIYLGQPYAIESALTLCQSRLYPPVSDLGFAYPYDWRSFVRAKRKTSKDL